MSYHGDIRLGETIDIKFVTTAAATGVPTQLAGSPVISAYVGNGTTEITAGITLTVDFDGRTGLNNVRVVATGGNGFATNTNVQLVITTGTVGGASAVGYVIGTFSIEARSAVMPTTAARTLDIAATGEAGVDFSNVLLPTTGAIPALNWIESGTMQSGSAAGTAVLRAATAFADSIPVGATILIYSGTGVGQSRLITAYTGATDTATVSPNWTTTPDNTSVYAVIGTAQSSGGGSAPTAAQVATAVWQDTTAGDFTVAGSIGRSLFTSGTLPGASGGLLISGTNAGTTTFGALTVTGATTFTGATTWTGALTASNASNNFRINGVAPGAANGVFIAGTNAATTITTGLTTTFTGNLTGSVGSVTGAVGSVTGAVGSVTGSVGGNVTGSVGSVIAQVTANVAQINGTTVLGNGTGGNLWRG
jgi:hypothetical protein